uniref:MABP domain-containing protein n=1 Tax=Anopheles marajoara TaxID=58244 RepID=A0A2M4BUY4_9DIPT
MLKSNISEQKTIVNSVVCFLPDDRPIKSLQLVEELERVPPNFHAINKTYDQDTDADLWREKTLIGKRTTRYLCQSKTEGLPNYIVSKVKVINEKEAVPEGFSQLTRTADTEQKAWRKKQLVYQLTKKRTTVYAITDIILCSRSRKAPQGFTIAGEINGILICYKLSKTSHSPCKTEMISTPRTPLQIDNDTANVKFQQGGVKRKENIKESVIEAQLDRDYVELLSSYRPFSQFAGSKMQIYSYSTYKIHAEVDGVPFILNPCLRENGMCKSLEAVDQMTATDLEYDFDLERHVLCTTKANSIRLTNPFFH